MAKASASGSGIAKHLPLALIAIGALIGVFFLRDALSFEALRDNQARLLVMRDSNFLFFAAGFAFVYVVVVAFSLPGGLIMSISGGFLFGLWVGTAINVVSATIGAAAIFWAARAGLGEALSAKMETSGGRIAKIKASLHENEVSVLLLLRLVPVVPFFVANLLPALVGVSFRNYLWTTLVGIIPGGLVYTWVGVGVGEVLERGGTPDLSLIREPYIIGPILGLCVLAALPIVLRRFRGTSEI